MGVPRPLIPKEPPVHELTEGQIEQLTQVVFLSTCALKPCDVIFVFGGTHPGHWEKTLEAYHQGLGPRVIVTGGVSPTGVKHADWVDPQQPEAKAIQMQLVQGGVNPDRIVVESRSRNTLENVLWAQHVFDFSRVKHVLFVGKSLSAGREYRTLVHQIPYALCYIPFGFDAEYDGHLITRSDWNETLVGRQRVLGEYLRIVYYGRLGHIQALDSHIDGLEGYVERTLN
jgi:hypothetical protein